MIKEYVKNHKMNIAIAILVTVLLFAVLAVFYWFKGQNEFYMSMADKIIIVACIGGTVALNLLDIKLPKVLNYCLEGLMLFGMPVFIFYRFESLVNDLSNCKGNAPFYNIVIIFMLLLLIYGLFGNTGASILIGGGALYLYYVSDYFTVKFRGSPLVFSDILSLRTAAGVANNYTYVFNDSIVVAFFELAFLTSIGFLVSGKNKKIKERLGVGLAALLISIGSLSIFVYTDFLYNKGFNIVAFVPINCSNENGLLLNGMVSAHASLLKAPEGYSKEKVEEIIDKYSGLSDENETSDVFPNIIVIMNESFTDIDYLETVTTSEETLPKFKAMKENCIKGTLISSILGGNTPNSEFECLTGCTMAFLPSGMVAYQQIIDSEMSTMASMFKNYGYSTDAVHLYDPSYFDRQRIYPLLGIDKFVNKNNYDKDLMTVEYFKDEYAADWCTFKLIENEYENKEDNKLFCFSVTIQNHGGYWGGLNDIQVLNVEDNVAYANEYVSLLKKTDDAFADLIEYFSNVSEPTLVIMYGDHQPYLFADDYVPVWDGYDYTDEEKRYMQAKVPFVIWANYDIEEQNMGEMSINYLGPTIMKAAGVKMSDYFAYLDNLRETLPVISAVCCVDKDGNRFYDWESSEYSELIREYEYLQYNYLKGKTDKEFYK